MSDSIPRIRWRLDLVREMIELVQLAQQGMIEPWGIGDWIASQYTDAAELGDYSALQMVEISSGATREDLPDVLEMLEREHERLTETLEELMQETT